MKHRPAPGRNALTVCLILYSLLAGGCSLKKAAPVKASFLLEARRADAAAPTKGTATLRVRNLQVAAPFEGRGFVYRLGDVRYESDFYHEFLASPRAMLTEQTRQWLAGSGLFQVVADSSSKVDATHGLSGNVSALFADYREASAPKAVLAVEFFVTDNRGAEEQIMFQRSYREEIVLTDRAPESLVRGWSTALGKILASLEKDLAQAALK